MHLQVVVSQIPTVLKPLLAILFVAAFSACETTQPRAKVVYGVEDGELNEIARRVGFRVEALGLSDYRFFRGNREFHVWAHVAIPVRGVLLADGPLELLYWPSRLVSQEAADGWNRDDANWGRIAVAVPGGEKRGLHSNLLIDGGVTMKTLELHFRRFINEIERFDEQLRTQR